MTKTNIDKSKVNLLEKDIEDWLWANPEAISIGSGLNVDYWMHRQLRLPSGILDLLGACHTDDHAYMVVVEVKNTPIKPDALTQVTRYAHDLGFMIRNNPNWEYEHELENWSIARVVVGQECDDRTFAEAAAMGIEVLQFKVNLSLSFSGWSWKDEYTAKRIRDLEELANDEDIADFCSMVFALNAPDYELPPELEEAIRNAVNKED